MSDDTVPASTEDLPRSTIWYRRNGRCTRREKAAKEQYLSPQEEKGLAAYVLRASKNGFPVSVKALRTLALVIRRRRSDQAHHTEGPEPPGKNWPQGFYRRNPTIKARRVKAMAWSRHDHSIYHKVVDWFSVIGKELASPAVLPENVYNMDETGILLSVLGSLKVLVDRDDLQNYRGAASQRTLITAIECISADGRALDPLIIWPASTHRSTWTTYPTPGWHFACSSTGYNNNTITMYWMQHVFDPLTKSRANGKPRVLISDGFGSHESLEVMTFCFENDILLCRLPSHTSHKLQPCDVAVFAPLKIAYREQVERLYRGGAEVIGKQHFTLLYSHARETAITARNIRAGWSKAGLFPFNPDRVLRDLAEPPSFDDHQSHGNMIGGAGPATVHTPLKTPTNPGSLDAMRTQLDRLIDDIADETSKTHVKKVVNAVEQSFARCALLADENRLLMAQNSEKKVRKSVKATVVGRAKVMKYEDIVQARERRGQGLDCVVNKAPRKRGSSARAPVKKCAKKSPDVQAEAEAATHEIAKAGLADYCTILHFD